ncbi:MAG: hypothetical protein HYX84_03515 [Chloroflexi bacterium]|nr:hypothetical protein [Chloroflexota bacterium]
MPIRRHITTTIDEIDDSADSHSPTNLPTPLVGKPSSDAQIETPTEFPRDSGESETPFSQGSRFSPPTIGRTFADLVVEFKNDHRAMAVILTVIPTVIFAAKVNSLESLQYPLAVAVILNVIWFGTPVLVTLLRKIKHPIAKM